MQKRRSRRERRRDPPFDVRSSMEITLLTVVSADCGRLLLAGWEIPALLSVPQINRNGAFQSAEQAKKATPSAIRITQTLLVSRNGGVVRLNEKLSTGQELHLRRHQDGDHWKSTRARVVAEIDQDPPHHFIYAIHILDPRSDFWDIEFPSLHKGEEALARLLMECSFCQRREVVYLDELQLKSFEIRKCVARICKHCDSPSIWIESQSEVRDPEAGLSASTVDERVLPAATAPASKPASWPASATAA